MANRPARSTRVPAARSRSCATARSARSFRASRAACSRCDSRGRRPARSWRQPAAGGNHGKPRGTAAHVAGNTGQPQTQQGGIRRAVLGNEGRVERPIEHAVHRIPEGECIRVQGRAEARRAGSRGRGPVAGVRRPERPVRLSAGRFGAGSCRRCACRACSGTSPASVCSCGPAPASRARACRSTSAAAGAPAASSGAPSSACPASAGAGGHHAAVEGRPGALRRLRRAHARRRASERAGRPRAARGRSSPGIAPASRGNNAAPGTSCRRVCAPASACAIGIAPGGSSGACPGAPLAGGFRGSAGIAAGVARRRANARRAASHLASGLRWRCDVRRSQGLTATRVLAPGTMLWFAIT